jgi:hypothetical protein
MQAALLQTGLTSLSGPFWDLSNNTAVVTEQQCARPDLGTHRREFQMLTGRLLKRRQQRRSVPTTAIRQPNR